MVMKYWNQICGVKINHVKGGDAMKKVILCFLLPVIFLFAGGAQAASIPADRPVIWSQLPDLTVNGDDHFSNNKTGDATLVADDFIISDGRPITDIHWWGSYLGALDAPDGFWIKLWSDKTGADPSQPDTAATDINNAGFSRYFTFGQVNEELYGYQSGPNLSAYQYYVDIAGDPFYEEAGTVYWISIQAVGSTTWGWKYTFSGQDLGDNAVVTALAYPGQVSWPETFQKIDGKNMAFELTTVPIPNAVLLLGSGLLGLIGIRRRRATSD